MKLPPPCLGIENIFFWVMCSAIFLPTLLLAVWKLSEFFFCFISGLFSSWCWSITWVPCKNTLKTCGCEKMCKSPISEYFRNILYFFLHQNSICVHICPLKCSWCNETLLYFVCKSKTSNSWKIWIVCCFSFLRLLKWVVLSPCPKTPVLSPWLRRKWPTPCIFPFQRWKAWPEASSTSALTASPLSKNDALSLYLQPSLLEDKNPANLSRLLGRRDVQFPQFLPERNGMTLKCRCVLVEFIWITWLLLIEVVSHSLFPLWQYLLRLTPGQTTGWVGLTDKQ